MPSDIARCGGSFDGYIPEKAQAEKHDVSVATLRRWKKLKYGPQPVQIGRKYFYRADASERFLAEQETATEHRDRPRRRR
jgi:hypothetical protein